MSSRFLIYNGPEVTTAAFASVATGTNIKTLLQVKPLVPLRIVEWGISFDGFAAAAPGKLELIEVDVAATVVAHANGDISKLTSLETNPDVLMTLSTTGTGYTASAEGSITDSRYLDGPQLIAPTTQFIKQVPLGERPVIQVGKFARIRIHMGATVNAVCYMIVEG